MERKEGETVLKPSDFYLGVVSFLGVLVPGAVFILLRGPSLQPIFLPPWLERNWVVVAGAVAAYIVGQILLSVTDLMNGLADWLARKTFGASEQAQSSQKSTERTNSDFHEALSYVRLHNAEAAGEIDHHMADYKLLRNLVVVFPIDIVWSLFDEGLTPSRMWWCTGLTLLSFTGFVRMRYWARFLAFQYQFLLKTEDKLVDTKTQSDRSDQHE